MLSEKQCNHAFMFYIKKKNLISWLVWPLDFGPCLHLLKLAGNFGYRDAHYLISTYPSSSFDWLIASLVFHAELDTVFVPLFFVKMS